MLEFVEEIGFDRRIIFPQVKWMTLDKFKQTLETNTPINPCLIDANKLLNKYVGKSMPKLANNDSNEIVEVSESIGTVEYDLNRQAWKLQALINGRVTDLTRDFLVLNIPDSNLIEWKTDLKSFNYAYRAAFNHKSVKSEFVGKSKTNTDLKDQLIFYSNSWIYIDSIAKPEFGKINDTNNLLFTFWKEIEIGHDQFEVLCLKPSPASLKTLCQLKIRQAIDHNQSRIKLLKNIPESLISFLSYPSILKNGQILLKNERLIDKNGKYELCINQANNLVHRCLNETNNNEKIIATDLTSIVFNRFQCVYFNQDSSAVHLLQLTNNNGYHFECENGNFKFTHFSTL